MFVKLALNKLSKIVHKMALFDTLYKNSGVGSFTSTKEYWDMFNRIAKDREIEPGWSKVEKDSVAEGDGVYVFRCMGDNHDIWEAYEYKKGDSLHFYFTGEHQHSDGWFPTVVPIDYLMIPSFGEAIPGWQKPVRQPKFGESMRLFNDGGFVIIALKIGNTIKYYDQAFCPYMKYNFIYNDKTAYFEPLWDIDFPNDGQDTVCLLGFYTI